ncbi:MAG: hypothetical protein AAGD32_02740 [Planctomycetota bacterium]
MSWLLGLVLWLGATEPATATPLGLVLPDPPIGWQTLAGTGVSQRQIVIDAGGWTREGQRFRVNVYLRNQPPSYAPTTAALVDDHARRPWLPLRLRGNRPNFTTVAVTGEPALDTEHGVAFAAPNPTNPPQGVVRSEAHWINGRVYSFVHEAEHGVTPGPEDDVAFKTFVEAISFTDASPPGPALGDLGPSQRMPLAEESDLARAVRMPLPPHALHDDDGPLLFDLNARYNTSGRFTVNVLKPEDAIKMSQDLKLNIPGGLNMDDGNGIATAGPLPVTDKRSKWQHVYLVLRPIDGGFLAVALRCHESVTTSTDPALIRATLSNMCADAVPEQLDADAGE